MKNSNLYQKWQELDKQERRELAAAVKAHGGEYVFIDCESDDAKEKWYESADHNDIPIIHGATKYLDGYDDYYVSRVVAYDDGQVSVYGFRAEYEGPEDEEYLNYIMYAQINLITDLIPETERVNDVSEQTPIKQ